jgi:competence ComEA-like helix-hairpin-helix protein
VNSRSITTILPALALLVSVSACIKRPRIHSKANEEQSATSSPTTKDDTALNPPRINLNTASANELETLPGIGKGLAARIIEHREKWGAFRRAEHLIIVRGISDRRFRALRDLITVE